MVWIRLEEGWFITSESSFSDSLHNPSIAKQYNYRARTATVLISILGSLQYILYKIKNSLNGLVNVLLLY